MSVFRRAGELLKKTWAKEPVLVVSFGFGFTAIILPIVSPLTKYTEIINKAMPYTYPVPVRDDGNMPDVPSHPCEKVGPSMAWLKNF